MPRIQTRLALHPRSVGRDAAIGEVSIPPAMPATEISGCGSDHCGG